MESVAHKKREHALLSASGAHRWMNCAPSAKLEAEYGSNEGSVYANEGTLAHELSELILRKDVLKIISEAEFAKELEKIKSNSLYKNEMYDVISIYTSYCIEQYDAARAIDDCAMFDVEQKLDLSEYVKDSFGTADCVILADNVMEVIDLKYGMGVHVSAEHNPQLMLYGLGAYSKYCLAYDISSIRLTIVQPRIDNISSWLISVEDLKKWSESILMPAAKAAEEGAGELSVGEWCRFCSVRNICRKLYEDRIEIAKNEFLGESILTDEEIADIVIRLPKLVEWANSIHEYAQTEAIKGKQWPGLKLVESRSTRKWKSEDEAAMAIIKEFPEISEDMLYNIKLKGITDVERMVGKGPFSKLSSVIVKAPGRPILVPESDNRKPIDSILDAKKDFS